MKKFIISMIILLSSSVQANVLTQMNSPLCDQIQRDQNVVVNALFCKNPDRFLEDEVCDQLECLVDKHITQCRRSLEIVSRIQGYTFFQGSVEMKA
ncbi:MAG: hypothetical protein CO099_03825, partial [Bdellovibrio sp. CG_4_9_14_3_um_filter_39_7]